MSYAGKYIDKAKEAGNQIVDQAHRAKEALMKNQEEEAKKSDPAWEPIM